MVASSMVTSGLTLHGLLDLAVDDEALLGDLAHEPLGVLSAFGVRLDADVLKQIMGIHGATDVELLQVLRSRIAPFEPGDCSCSS